MGLVDALSCPRQVISIRSSAPLCSLYSLWLNPPQLRCSDLAGRANHLRSQIGKRKPTEEDIGVRCVLSGTTTRSVFSSDPTTGTFVSSKRSPPFQFRNPSPQWPHNNLFRPQNIRSQRLRDRILPPEGRRLRRQYRRRQNPLHVTGSHNAPSSIVPTGTSVPLLQSADR